VRVREQGYLKGGDISSAVVMVGLMSERKTAFESIAVSVLLCWRKLRGVLQDFERI